MKHIIKTLILAGLKSASSIRPLIERFLKAISSAILRRVTIAYPNVLLFGFSNSGEKNSLGRLLVNFVCKTIQFTDYQ